MDLKGFKEKLLSDEAFAAKFANIDTPEALVELAAKEGFNFTVEDIINNTELTDAELEAAAGGIDSQFIIDLGNSFFGLLIDS